jgi:hypothetical protein
MSTDGTRTPVAQSSTARKAAALLCVAIALIHVVHQGGVAPLTPHYIGVGFYLVEVVAAISGALLMASPSPTGWWVSVAGALGPLVGYLTSRGPGLPDDSADRGDWMNPMGMVSLAVETAVLALAVTALVHVVRARRQVRASEGDGAGPAAEPGTRRPHGRVPLGVVHAYARRTRSAGRQEPVRTEDGGPGCAPDAVERWSNRMAAARRHG